MRISVNWLRELVPALSEGAEEIAERLSMTAVAVEEVIPVGRGLEGIRVARALEVRPHPDADRLLLCRVDAGEGRPVDVVCGAPTVEEGSLYAFAPPGSRLPDGPEIGIRTIRGVESHGMLCSEKELGLGRDASGILALPAGLEPGLPLSEALGFPDLRLELDLTPNRVDLACHVGVARELAPGGEADLELREFGGPGWSPEWAGGERSAAAGGVEVRIEDPERCPRYLGAVIRGVEVGPSPAWLAARLHAVGTRPINNVVDATNYVLHELNQPLHAFDLGTIAGPEIRVRAAAEGEEIRTLDGDLREADPEWTVIADAGAPVGLAGVMGGEESEVTAETTDVFLECASFSPTAVRATARGAGLATDASYRFERGIDERALERALVRCVELILATAGGEAAEAAARVGREPPTAEPVPLRPARVRQLLGIELSPEEVRGLLEPLGFRPEEGGSGEELLFAVPGWRGDVAREVDLIEEVARRHGYEEFPAERRAFRPTAVPDHPAWAREERVRELFHARGFLEARSMSLVSEAEAHPEAPVALLNPLSAEEGYLRGTLVPVLLRRVEHNFARGMADVRLYEIGTVFREDGPREGDVGPYREELRAAAVLTGRRRPEHWGEDPLAVDVWDLKGLAEEVAATISSAELSPAADGREGTELGAAGWLGAERFRILSDGDAVGVAGRVRPEAVDAPPWAGPVWGLEVRVDRVEAAPRRAYRELSRFPPVNRDLAVTLPVGAAAAEAEATIRGAAPEFLEELRLFDVYEGDEIGEGRRSLAFRFRFRAPDRTLQDEEVDRAMSRIAERLEERCDARIRSG